VITPDPEEVGRPSKVWIGGVLNGTVYLRDGPSTWVEYQGGAFPVALTSAALPPLLEVSIVSVDVSAVPGLDVYVGYGRTEADLSLSGHLAKVFTTVPASCGAATASQGYVINSIVLPQSRTMFSIDLNGDARLDNQYGNFVGAMTAQNLDQQAVMDARIQSGEGLLLVRQNISNGSFTDASCASADLEHAQTRASPDFSGNGVFVVDPAARPLSLPGTIAASHFSGSLENPTAQDTLAVDLVFAGAVQRVNLVDPHIAYTITDSGLISGTINGAIRASDLPFAAIAAGLNASIAANPFSPQSKQLLQIFDTGGIAQGSCGATCMNPDGSCAQKADGTISVCELSDNSIIKNVLNPDVQLFDASGNLSPNPANTTRDSLSVGLGFTAVKATF
jgi:hypothetical protein